GKCPLQLDATPHGSAAGEAPRGHRCLPVPPGADPAVDACRAERARRPGGSVSAPRPQFALTAAAAGGARLDAESDTPLRAAARRGWAAISGSHTGLTKLYRRRKAIAKSLRQIDISPPA